MSNQVATYSDGLEDGQRVGLFMAYRIIKAEKKLHAYNSGAGRVLKTLEEKLKNQADFNSGTSCTDMATQGPGSIGGAHTSAQGDSYDQ